jgi:hypothetical protein
VHNTVTEAKEYKWSCSTAEAPFHNFWQNISYTNHDLNSTRLHDDGIKTKDDINCRAWISDNRVTVINKAKSIAKALIAVDGIMYAEASEPFYYTITFGLGGNHGSTDMMIGSQTGRDLRERFEFPATQFEEALAYASKTAENRSDTNSLPITPHEYIEVIIPESIRKRRKNQYK